MVPSAGRYPRAIGPVVFLRAHESSGARRRVGFLSNTGPSFHAADGLARIPRHSFGIRVAASHDPDTTRGGRDAAVSRTSIRVETATHVSATIHPRSVKGKALGGPCHGESAGSVWPVVHIMWDGTLSWPEGRNPPCCGEGLTGEMTQAIGRDGEERRVLCSAFPLYFAGSHINSAESLIYRVSRLKSPLTRLAGSAEISKSANIMSSASIDFRR